MRNVPERQDSDREVLTSLPRTRPVRRSAKRGERADTKSATATATTTRRAAPAKPRAAKPSAAKAGAAKAGAKTPAAKPRPKATADGSDATRPRRTSTTGERSSDVPKRKVPPAGYASPSSRAEDPSASGAADLIGTTLQAAVELAQIGLTVGRQTLQSMFDRLPKP